MDTISERSASVDSVYLEAVAQARDQREQAELHFRAALARAAEHHSLRTIAPYAGLSFTGVHWLLTHKETSHAVDKP